MPIVETIKGIGAGQLKVLKALWRLKGGTVAEVRAAHASDQGETLAYTTVMTVLGKLVEKGLVQVDKTREPYLYKPLRRPDAVLKDRLRQFVATVFDGKPEALVLHLVETEALSAEDLRRIERKLRAKEDERK
jgi:BlaI family penicillinase repressor